MRTGWLLSHRSALRGLALLALMLGFALPTMAQPRLGMSFPPVKTAAEIAFTVEKLQALGVRDIRIAEAWAMREPNRGNYNWQAVEARIGALSAAGLRIMLTIQSDGPDWACGARNNYTCEITDWPAFEAYVTALLGRVGGQLASIQFGNEWDNLYVGNVAQYIAQQNAFYDLVKRVQPGLTVVLGGITTRAQLYEAVCLNGMQLDQSAYGLRRELDLNAYVQNAVCGRARAGYAADLAEVEMVLKAARYDLADIHLYDTPDLWPEFIRSFTRLSRAPVIVSEFGGPNPELERDDPLYQAGRLVDYLMVMQGLPVDLAYYFKLTDDDSSYHNRSGLFDRQGREKPALDVFENR